MGFRVGAWAMVWAIEPKGTWTKVRLSTSRRDRETGEYIQDFSGFVMMAGHAHAKAQRLHEKDRIRLGEVDVTTTYNREQNREYVNYRCFEFQTADEFENDHPAPPRQPDSNPVEGDNDPDDDQLPF